jgi:hypothetical protein
MESFGSMKAGPSLVNSNGFFIFSAEDAFSTIDFSKAPIPQRYRRSRQSSQFYRPFHVASAMEMTNANENSPCFLEPASEVELEALCTDDTTIVLNMGARTNPNCSSNIVLQSKGYWKKLLACRGGQGPEHQTRISSYSKK